MKYGYLVEFKTPEHLIGAAKKVRESGLSKLDAFSPFPMEELYDAIGFEKERTALVALVGGLIGGLGAFGMQWYCNVFDYPINVGGRPDYSWPAFIPVTFELTVLGGALFAAFGMMALNRLPRINHPVFSVPEFARASRDRFFLCISAEDRLYNVEKIKIMMKDFAPLNQYEVENE